MKISKKILALTSASIAIATPFIAISCTTLNSKQSKVKELTNEIKSLKDGKKDFSEMIANNKITKYFDNDDSKFAKMTDEECDLAIPVLEKTLAALKKINKIKDAINS
ncbi:variable surface lipoprotein [Mycoplasma phocoenae]|uniref:Lipoprotein n=1 Tax=Mycoplasma phocoenae TaxID=754517 RepID=A0A858U270_9MOLU|nr:variable surface lipoprotein [Mycoplasma phocoenae]QJG67244.1 hypothetical protein HGG69_02935 [Mycoplasma phocoenae]